MLYTFLIVFTKVFIPRVIMFILLSSRILVSMFYGGCNKGGWVSYIFYIVMLGGLLILFVYIVSFVTRESFDRDSKGIKFFFSVRFIFFIIFFIDWLPIGEEVPVGEKFMELLPTGISLYTIPSFRFTLFILVFLLYLLIIIVNIIDKFRIGSLRSFK